MIAAPVGADRRRIRVRRKTRKQTDRIASLTGKKRTSQINDPLIPCALPPTQKSWPTALQQPHSTRLNCRMHRIRSKV